MNVIYFQFKKHPGDLYRDSQVAKLPNPEKEKEEFWVWFLDNF